MTLSWSKAYVTIEKLKKKISTLKAENEMLKKDIAHRSLAIVIGTDFISKQKVMEAIFNEYSDCLNRADKSHLCLRCQPIRYVLKELGLSEDDNQKLGIE